ncbi:MAG: hypothetical protein AAB394_01845 [Patescibacteria group bacterium]
MDTNFNFNPSMSPFMQDVQRTLVQQDDFRGMGGHGFENHGGHGWHNQISIGFGQDAQVNFRMQMPEPPPPLMPPEPPGGGW